MSPLPPSALLRQAAERRWRVGASFTSSPGGQGSGGAWEPGLFTGSGGSIAVGGGGGAWQSRKLSFFCSYRLLRHRPPQPCRVCARARVCVSLSSCLLSPPFSLIPLRRARSLPLLLFRFSLARSVCPSAFFAALPQAKVGCSVVHKMVLCWLARLVVFLFPLVFFPPPLPSLPSPIPGWGVCGELESPAERWKMKAQSSKMHQHEY